jgi:hypothetical protein
MDEKTIRGLELLVEREQDAVDSLERQFPTDEMKALPRQRFAEVHALKTDAWRDLQLAKTKLAEARAEFERTTREKADDAVARNIAANERMAQASEVAAKHSADAAVAARSAARWTLAAAVVAAFGIAIQAWQAWHTRSATAQPAQPTAAAPAPPARAPSPTPPPQAPK